jgi:hypothetical protein
MNDSEILARIEAWQAAGLIDPPTAERLRVAEAEARDTSTGQKYAVATASALFGPGISVAEMFAYVGGGFLLAAWYAFIGRLADELPMGDVTWSIGAVVVAILLGVMGLRIRAGSPRMSRAAGTAFVASAAQFGVAAYTFVDELVNRAGAGQGGDIAPALAGAAALLAAAVVYRYLHPALLTQIGLVGAILASSAAIMRWLEPILFGGGAFDPVDGSGQESPVRVILIAIGWGATSVVLGLIGLREARSSASGAGSRAAITRFVAGMTAILGTTGAVMATGSLGADEYGRLIPAAVGDAALIAVSAVLLERAFRRATSAFVYPAALGVIIGLSDLNATYLAEATGNEFALLVEGLILLGAGLVFDRLRRRVNVSNDVARTDVAARVEESGPA